MQTPADTIGEAADIYIPKTAYTEWDDGKAHTDKAILNCWFDWIIQNTNFDQAIIETSNGKDFWIHVSCRKNTKKNRKQVIRLISSLSCALIRMSDEGFIAHVI